LLFNAGTLIDLFGVGSPYSRNGKKSSELVIDFTGLRKGGLGSSGLEQFTEVDNHFEAELIGRGSYDLHYTLRFITVDRLMVRKFISMFQKNIADRGYFKVIDGNTFSDHKIYGVLGDWLDTSTIDLTEYTAEFVFTDVWLGGGDNKTIREVPMLVDIDMNIDMRTKLSESDGNDSTQIIESGCKWKQIEW
jgi:hypothetical protein